MAIRSGSSARLVRVKRHVPAPLSPVPVMPAQAEPMTSAPVPAVSEAPVAQPSTPAPSFQPPAPANDTAAQPVETGLVSIIDIGAILGRRWRTVAAVTLLTTLLGTAAALTMAKRYTATTSIFIDPRIQAAFQTENLNATTTYDPNLVDSLTMVIGSETVLRRVVKAEKLDKDPEFAGSSGDAQVNAVLALSEAIKVKRPERTYVVEVAVRTLDAQKSARLANAIANAYLTDGSDNKNATMVRERGWLDKRIEELERRLRDAEARVADYKAKNQIYGAEGALVGEKQLSDINRGLGEAQRRASEAKATLDQVELLRRGGKLPDATSEALKSPVIDRLRGQQTEIQRLQANTRTTLGPRHPAAIEVEQQMASVQHQIHEELARIAENARSSFAVARSNVQGLERELERLKKSESQTSQALLGLRELERAVEAQKSVYEKFLRDKEAITRLSVETPAGRVIQQAEVPLRASSPNRPLIALLSLAGGLFLGVGAALVGEALSRDRSRGGNRSGAGNGAPAPAPLPPLRLPALAKRRWLGLGAAPAPLAALAENPDGAFARAAGTLANRLWPFGAGPSSLLVSALAPPAGQPALVLALAMALARQGRAVLMVDGHGGAQGLTNHFAAQATPVELPVAGHWRAALQLPVAAPAPIYLLPFSALPPAARPARRAAAELTLIDGPAIESPDFAVLDLARAIDGVLAVAPAGTRRLAARSDELTKRLGNALLGVVTTEG